MSYDDVKLWCNNNNNNRCSYIRAVVYKSCNMPKTNFCRGQRPLLSQALVKLGNQPICCITRISWIVVAVKHKVRNVLTFQDIFETTVMCIVMQAQQKYL